MSNEIVKVDPKRSPLSQYSQRLNRPVGDKDKCQLCKSTHLEAAQEEFERTKSFKAVYNFLNTKKAGISYWSVRRHLLKHFLGGQRASKIEDYAEEILGWLDEPRDKRTAMLERLSILQRKMYLIDVESDHGSVDEQRKTADALKKLNDGISLIEEKLDEMDKVNEPVLILWDTIKAALVNKIKSSKLEESKRDLMDVLDQVEKAYDAMSDNEEDDNG